jgi:hypothetical protein
MGWEITLMGEDALQESEKKKAWREALSKVTVNSSQIESTTSVRTTVGR